MTEILFQDRHLLLVEKPVGLSSQEEPEPRDSFPRRLTQAGLPVKPVHRLDCQTGGVMVYARTRACAAALSALVGDHSRFLKEYVAVVHGCPQEVEGRLEDLLYHDVKRNKSFVVKRERKGVRHAALSYRVIETTATPEGELSLVWIQLHTGRTHQIRVQFASRGLPLYGDSRYGGGGGTLGLWSRRLTFPHPATGETIKGESIPDLSLAPWCYFNDLSEV